MGIYPSLNSPTNLPEEPTIERGDGSIEYKPDVEIEDASIFEVNHVFQEWARVRLADKWFDISDKKDWWSNVKINKAEDKWEWTAETHEMGLGAQN